MAEYAEKTAAAQISRDRQSIARGQRLTRYIIDRLDRFANKMIDLQHMICLCFLLVITSVDGYRSSSSEHPIHRPQFANGIERTIHWPSADPVPIQKEIQLLMSNTLIRRGEFGKVYGSRALDVELSCNDAGLTFHQGVSIRKQLLMKKAMKSAWRLKDEKIMKSICKDFDKQRPILDISLSRDLSPVSLFKSIMASRVLEAYPRFSSTNRSKPAGRIVQSIINETDEHHIENFLTNWEFNELKIAKENDIVGYEGTSTIAEEWEETIYKYLDEQNINYITEDTLKAYGFEEKGTPDCLLIDNLVLNGQPLRWIEFKSFYGSGLKENAFFTKKAICKQITKYDRTYGKGAMVFKHNISSKISQRYPATLFLDGGMLHTADEFNLFG